MLDQFWSQSQPVMLWTGHARGTHLGYVTGSPQGQFPDHSQSVAGPALVVFILIAGSTSKQPPERELGKNKAYFSQVLEALRGLKRASVDLGFAFIEVGSGRAYCFEASFSLVNFKYKSRN